MSDTHNYKEHLVANTLDAYSPTYVQGRTPPSILARRDQIPAIPTEFYIIVKYDIKCEDDVWAPVSKSTFARVALGRDK